VTRSPLLLGLLAAALTISVGASADDSLARADAALQAGKADEAQTLLNSLPTSANVHNLKCRVQFALEKFDAAVNECELAVTADNQNSDYHMWLGRALGEKAERASFLTAFSLAKRVCAEFEAAVRLDGRNAPALADLGEFYSSAPGIVGGGFDKAERVVAQLDAVDQARAHELRARIAEGQKDYGTAEREFKLALAASQHPAFQWMTLASFYRRRAQWAGLDDAIDSGIKATQHDRRAGVALFNGSSVLSRANRNLSLSAKMLEDYLASSSLTEEAPAFVAYTQLARLKNQLGDQAGARAERAKALALANDYKPAQDLRVR
jgi:tetratricopeptide (TPR) repeat protein